MPDLGRWEDVKDGSAQEAGRAARLTVADGTDSEKAGHGAIQTEAEGVAHTMPPLPAPAGAMQSVVLMQVQRQPVLGPPSGSFNLRATVNVTERELAALDPQIAAESLIAQARGYDVRGPTANINPAQTNAHGCWLSQSRAQDSGGHTLMVPVKPRARTRAANGAGAQTTRQKQQYMHRLAIRAFKPLPVQRLMFEAQTDDRGHAVVIDVSHLCHEPTCFNPQHLNPETRSRNQLRDRARCSQAGRCACGLVPACIV